MSSGLSPNKELHQEADGMTISLIPKKKSMAAHTKLDPAPWPARPDKTSSRARLASPLGLGLPLNATTFMPMLPKLALGFQAESFAIGAGYPTPH
jgi:hypothetical protein